MRKFVKPKHINQYERSIECIHCGETHALPESLWDSFPVAQAFIAIHKHCKARKGAE